jgi:hypothetical protein
MLQASLLAFTLLCVLRPSTELCVCVRFMIAWWYSELALGVPDCDGQLLLGHDICMLSVPQVRCMGSGIPVMRVERG